DEGKLRDRVPDAVQRERAKIVEVCPLSASALVVHRRSGAQRRQIVSLSILVLGPGSRSARPGHESVVTTGTPALYSATACRARGAPGPCPTGAGAGDRAGDRSLAWCRGSAPARRAARPQW